MPKVRFIHTADLHLDTPFKGLSGLKNELADRLKQATLKSFDRIIALCIEKQVDFLLISGDIFDSTQHSLTAQLKLVAGLERLSEQNIPVFFVCGNHDPLNSWLPILELPSNVTRFGAKKTEKIPFKREDHILADIYGISFPTKEVKENLALLFNRTAQPAPISIAVLHGTIGSPGKHEKYAPFSKEQVSGKGFDYWALGHIHKHQVIQSAHPALVYPGNPQGRDFGETGIRGCYLVEIEAGGKPVLEFLPTQQVRFEEQEVDLTGMNKISNLPEKIMKAGMSIDNYDENTGLILRIKLTGKTSLHKILNQPGRTEELTNSMNENALIQTGFVWIDRILTKTIPEKSLEELKKAGDFPAEILKISELYEKDSKKLSELINQIYSELPAQIRQFIPSGYGPLEQKDLFDKSKWVLLDHFLEENR